ncbi:HAD hydrolase family protein [Polyangium aurulentum]|uniref:HAD hydrolase family protein n=1 Tax=Polyangium aurulentum TaxID=2567896 RepID=UPI001F2DCC59|nr:HAD hydrolase family protein [Polyangium aurulentum]
MTGARVPEGIEALSRDEAMGLGGVVFDLDDTLLDHGALTEVAYGALFRLREMGLRLVACTGRPALWGEIVLRQWPIDAAVTENGAVALIKEPPPEGASAARISAVFPADAAAWRARRGELVAFAEGLVKRFPDAALADDNAARWTDVTIDIGEHRRVRPEDVQAMREEASARGLVTVASSVHLHLAAEAADKAKGTFRLLAERFGEDEASARVKNAFVGDSGNDAAAFAAFATTVGVANVRPYLRNLPVLPRYVTQAAMGRGFAEFATRIMTLRVKKG